nr:hypothetical protein Iba_chr09cCG2190 [Ipomoea batatas]
MASLSAVNIGLISIRKHSLLSFFASKEIVHPCRQIGSFAPPNHYGCTRYLLINNMEQQAIYHMTSHPLEPGRFMKSENLPSPPVVLIESCPPPDLGRPSSPWGSGKDTECP